MLYNRLICALYIAAWLSTPAFLRAASPDLSGELSKYRYELNVQGKNLAGPGATVLKQALADAQFVLVGEDHGIAQIPEFVGAVCGVTGPQGFHTMAIETGPLAAHELEQWAGAADHRTKIIDFEKRFPLSIPFYDIQEENDLLSDCARSAGAAPFRVWGLDQEFIGSARLILTRILELNPGYRATLQTKHLLDLEAQATAKVAKTGNLGSLFVLDAPEAELAKLHDMLQAEGNVKALALLDALSKSHRIYRLNGSGYDYNRARSLLMKTTFTHYYEQAKKDGGAPPKVLFKFGALHLYKGFNPARSAELGDFITELADFEHTRSLHIFILAEKGTQLRFGSQTDTFNHATDNDPDFASLRPMFDNMLSSGWTMFDFRALRKVPNLIASVDRDVERLVMGYDLLIVIPQAVPSRPIQ